MGVRKGLRDGARDGLGLLRLVVGEEDGKGATELCDGVGDAHAFAKGYDANLYFEEVDIELKEDVARDFLLYEILSGNVERTRNQN